MELKSDDVNETSHIHKYPTYHDSANIKLYCQNVLMRGLQGAYILWTEHHGWSYEWFQLLGAHHVIELPDSKLPLSNIQFLIIDNSDDNCNNLYVKVNINIFLSFRVVEISIASFFMASRSC